MSTRKPKSDLKPAGSVSAALPPEISDRIDDERRRLQQAAAVLAVLAIAFEYEPEGVDFADAALAARAMVDQAMTALDPTALRQVSRHIGTAL